MWGKINGLRVLDLGTPGPMRAELNGLVLSGLKKATAGRLREDYEAENEPVEEVGEHLALVDDDGACVATLEVTAVEVVPFEAVTWEFAQAEGEGFRSLDHWREAHRRFWHDEGTADTDLIVCTHFRLL